MELQEICSQVVAGADGVRGCLLLDMETGLPLAQSTAPGVVLPAEQIVADTREIFRGGLTGQFARALTPPRELPGFVEEAQLTTAEAQYFMASVPGWDDSLLVLVADKALRVGIGWMRTRQASQQFAGARGSATPQAEPAWSTNPEPAPAAPGPGTVEPIAATADPAPAWAPPEAGSPGEPASVDADPPHEAVSVDAGSYVDAGSPDETVAEEQPPAAPPDTLGTGVARPPEPPLLVPDAPTAVPSPVLSEPPRAVLTEPPRVARGRAPSIRARRSIPMAQLLGEAAPTEPEEPATPGDAQASRSEVGRFGARASLRGAPKRP